MLTACWYQMRFTFLKQHLVNMATNGRTMKTLQLFLCCLLPLFIDYGSLVLGKPSNKEQSLWNQIDETTDDQKEEKSNRIPLEPDVNNNTTAQRKETDSMMNASKRFTIIRDNFAHGFGGRHCLQNAIHICDLRDFATLISPPATPCTLIGDFQTCISEETDLCLDPDVILLKTSLTSILQGFHANGKCSQVPVIFRDALLVNGEMEECKPELTWQCALQLVTDLKGPSDTTCDAILRFRNCIRLRSRSCGYMGARFLGDGAQGLVWAYKKASYCK